MPVTGRTTKAIGPPLSVVAGLNYPRGLLSPSRSSVAQLVSVLVRSSSLSSRRSRAHLVLPISATRHPSGFFFRTKSIVGEIEWREAVERVVVCMMAVDILVQGWWARPTWVELPGKSIRLAVEAVKGSRGRNSRWSLKHELVWVR